MKKIKLIYNPFSGEGIILKYLDRIIEIFQLENIVVVPFRISKTQPLDMAFEDIDSSYDYIIGAGGDGTINRIVNIMKNKDIQLPLGILPLGTANDFAKYIGMTGDIEEDCKIIIGGKRNKVDLGRVNDKYFINVFSFGMFTDISQKTPTIQKNLLGKLAYYVNGVKELPNFKKVDCRITTEQEEYQGSAVVVLVFNGRTAGNLNLSYKSEINDGILDIIVLRGENLRKTIVSLIEFLQGKHLEKNNDFVHLSGTKIRIETEEIINTDIDGEKGPELPVDIVCEKDNIEIIY